VVEQFDKDKFPDFENIIQHFVKILNFCLIPIVLPSQIITNQTVFLVLNPLADKAKVEGN
jgi:ABC-type polysaccharide/polyol phosphate export permease